MLERRHGASLGHLLEELWMRSASQCEGVDEHGEVDRLVPRHLDMKI